MATPRHPVVISPQAALDGDIDEEMQLHQNVTPPPPPPPPRRKGGSSRHERRTMEQVAEQPEEQERQQEQEQLPSPESPTREPLNNILASQEQPEQQQYESIIAQEQKEQSGCDIENSPMKSKTKPPKPTSSGSSRPPKQPVSKSAEYGTKLESFHMIMLENIEKETNMIRRSGSFQYHQDHLSNQKNDRKHLNQDTETDNRGTPKRKGNRTNNTMGNNNNGSMVHGNNMGSLLKETMNDISVAAASTMETLRFVIQQHTTDHASGGRGIIVGGTVVPLPINMACGNIDDSATAFGMEDNDDDGSDIVERSADPTAVTPPRKSTSSKNKINHTRNNSGSDLMKKMQDGIKKLVVDATTNATNQEGGKKEHRGRPNRDESDKSSEAWGVGNLLANGFGWEEDNEDEETASRATYDTWDDENSVLRRLGSWGTVNSQFTAGTAGTGATFGTMATYETDSIVGPVSAAVAKAAAAKAGMLGPDGQPQNGDQLTIPPPGNHHLIQGNENTAYRDDEGNPIDPALANLGKKKKKRKPRRKRVVKFAYPPIKSLRQYERPDVEDLPNLFFTEQELDQIENDRYSTMSTDDIEIVAVASKESSSSQNGDDALGGMAAASSNTSKKKSKEEEHEKKYEKGFKPVKGRSLTPNRRRMSGGDSGSDKKKKASKNKQSPSKSDNDDTNEEGPTSPRRLVKGVQIYLRERSTGM